MVILGLVLGVMGSAVRAQVGGEVAVDREWFGVGNVVRAGSWAGVRVRVEDRSDRAREAVVRLSVRDPDGDTLVSERGVTLNPGGTQGVWLYVPLPWSTTTMSAFDVSVEEVVGEGGGRRLLGSGRVGPRDVARDSDPLIGVLGSMPAGGLGAYGVTPEGADEPLGAHELTRIVTGLEPGGLPDRWMGLAAYEALVWLEGAPGALTEGQAGAIEEWVRRGGKLVVSMPSVGQAWLDPRANPLGRIMPLAGIERRESFDLERARALLRPRDGVPLPRSRTVHLFTARAGASVADATPVLRIDDGVVVMRRVLDAGSVTLVGFDLSDVTLGGNVDAQMFWHRLLGRRFDVLSRDEVRRLVDANRVNLFTRSRAWIDEGIGNEIAKSGSASIGVLLALIVFAAYLVLAGPGSYAVLRAKRAAQWSWVVFAGIAGVFTAIAWGGAAATRPLKTEVKHLTFVDHVYGQAHERATSWMSVLLPSYGDREVSIEGEQGPERVHNALAPWQDPRVLAAASFPDTRPYVMDARDPSSLTTPARSTVKQFRADWLGGPAWRMPTPVREVRVVGSGSGGALTGVLTHELPGPLRDVVIVLVRSQLPLGAVPAAGGRILAQTSAWRLTTAWEAGKELDLAQTLTPTGAAGAEQYFESLSKEVSPSLGGPFAGPDVGSGSRALRRFEALAWRTMLGPPDYLNRGVDTQFLLQARDGLGPDMGVWFTQPCLIIVGRLDDAPLPIPLRVDGREAPSEGRVVVRWVYPLAPSPPEVLR